MKMCVNGLKDVKRYSMKNAISFRISGKLKKAENSIQTIRILVSSVLQKLKTPPKTIAQSSDKFANFWQISEHMQREMRNDWYVYSNVSVQNVIAAEVNKKPYDP